LDQWNKFKFLFRWSGLKTSFCSNGPRILSDLSEGNCLPFIRRIRLFGTLVGRISLIHLFKCLHSLFRKVLTFLKIFILYNLMSFQKKLYCFFFLYFLWFVIFFSIYIFKWYHTIFYPMFRSIISFRVFLRCMKI